MIVLFKVAVPAVASTSPPSAGGGDGVVDDGVVGGRQDADAIDATAVLSGVVVGEGTVDERQVAREIVGDGATVE